MTLCASVPALARVFDSRRVGGWHAALLTSTACFKPSITTMTLYASTSVREAHAVANIPV